MPIFAAAFQLKPPIVSWCNGSTTDFGSVCLGSNPGETTLQKANIFIINMLAFLFLGLAPTFAPHKQKNGSPVKVVGTQKN